VPWLLNGLAALYGRSGITRAMPPIANLVISNVSGPKLPLYVAGARMASYWPLSIVEHGVGLNITVLSYAGAMGFGFTCARSAVPEPRELAAALLAALDELLALAPRAARKPPVRPAPAAAAKPPAGPRRRRSSPAGG